MKNHYHSQAILERAQRKHDVDTVDWKVERPTIHNHVFKPSSLKRAWKLVYDKMAIIHQQEQKCIPTCTFEDDK